MFRIKFLLNHIHENICEIDFTEKIHTYLSLITLSTWVKSGWTSSRPFEAIWPLWAIILGDALPWKIEYKNIDVVQYKK